MSEGPLPAFGLIQPENIPGRTIDVGQIQDAAELLDTKAHAIRVQGALVESEWDGLAGVYDAPEAPDLFLLMKGERGVGTRTDALASNFSKAASALTTLSYAIASTVQELKDLHAEALEFRATIQNGLVEATGFGETIHESAETTGHIPWADHPPTNARNTELIQAVNAGLARLDAAQADAVNAINALDATTAGTFAAPYTPVSLDGLNAPGVPSGWGPSRVPDSCSYENVRNAGIGWVEGTVVGVSALFGLDPFSLEFTADAGAAWSGLGMTAAGLVLFASPAGWAVQAALGAVKSGGGQLPAPVKAADDFVTGATDQIAAAVGGLTQWDTWGTDPGKAATNVFLNAASMVGPSGLGSGALKTVSSTVKVGALVEKLEAIGTKIGGPTGDAFTAGVRGTTAGSADALRAVKAILDAPDVLAREAAAAAKKALDELAARIPTFEPSLAGIDNGHMNNESAESATSGTGGGSSSSSSGSGHGGSSSSTGYDPNNYSPDGTIKAPEFGEISPEHRAELLDQKAAHDDQVGDSAPNGVHSRGPDGASSGIDGDGRPESAGRPSPGDDSDGGGVERPWPAADPTGRIPGDQYAPDATHPGGWPPRNPIDGDPDGGPGKWGYVNRGDSEAEWKYYQAQIGGTLADGGSMAPEYLLPRPGGGNPVAIEGHDWRGDPPKEFFLDAKHAYGFYGDPNRTFLADRQNESFAEQATRQLEAIEHAGSEGTLEWHLDDKSAADSVREHFIEKDIRVLVYYTPNDIVWD